MKAYIVYELWLHDTGNLQSQLLDCSLDAAPLAQMAEKMNYLLAKGGHKTLEAEVIEKQEVVEPCEEHDFEDGYCLECGKEQDLGELMDGMEQWLEPER